MSYEVPTVLIQMLSASFSHYLMAFSLAPCIVHMSFNSFNQIERFEVRCFYCNANKKGGW
ncbi:MAG: hypothetical protein ACRQFF_03640 [Sphaerochaeta sp.]